MICTAIDIGTNSVLLLIANKTDGRLEVIEERQEVPRLGKGVDSNKKLDPDSIVRVLNVLENYHQYLSDNYSSALSKTIVTATSAVRDASNREEFMRLVKVKTGWGIVLLSGEQEAITTYRGALSVLKQDIRSSKNAVLDIGGGSTEIATGQNYFLDKFISLDMGSVRFSERYFKNDPPGEKSLIELKNEVTKMYKNSGINPAEIGNAVGVAGTVTSVAAIEMGLQEYESQKLNNYRLKASVIEKFITEFSSMTAADIEKKYPVFLKNRGDVILGGLLILYGFLEWIELDEIIVSTGGIRHGVLIDS